jgi:D-alanine-D-alanine ligase
MISGYKPQHKILITIAGEKTTRDDICAVSRCKDSVEKVFLKKGIKPEVLFIEKNDFNGTSRLKKKILEINPSCVFNLFEGFSKDPQKEVILAKLLENVKIPFTGNGSFALSACLDKIKAKSILEKNNLPVARGFLVKSLKRNALSGFTFPLFVKPCREDGSCGIHKDSLVYNEEELFSTIEKRLKHFPKGLIVEEFLPGKEYSVAFIGNNYYEALGISEIDYSWHKVFLPARKARTVSRYEPSPFLTYEAKWRKKTLDYRSTMPDYEPKITKTLRRDITGLARQAAKALGCRGYFRVDLRENGGKFFIIDINPNPDINRDSGYLKLAYIKGYTYDKIIEKVVWLSNYH